MMRSALLSLAAVAHFGQTHATELTSYSNVCTGRLEYHYLSYKWENARDYCRAYGGELPSIHTYAREHQVRNAVPNYGEFWVGYQSHDTAYNTTWSDGSPFDYHHWGASHPQAYECGCFNPADGEYWWDRPCNQKLPFVCCYPEDETPYPTKEPTPYPTKQPTPYPTKAPTPYPTKEPTPYPTKEPTAYPTKRRTPYPTRDPTPYPTKEPTPYQTRNPTPYPTKEPTPYQTRSPTPYPTKEPTPYPTKKPTPYPTKAPTPSPNPQCPYNCFYRFKYPKVPNMPLPYPGQGDQVLNEGNPITYDNGQTASSCNGETTEYYDNGYWRTAYYDNDGNSRNVSNVFYGSGGHDLKVRNIQSWMSPSLMNALNNKLIRTQITCEDPYALLSVESTGAQLMTPGISGCILYTVKGYHPCQDYHPYYL